jgi:O-antigen ligase
MTVTPHASIAGRAESTGPLESRRLRLLGRLALGHAAVLLAFVTWALGGETDFARRAITLWGGIALAITLAGCVERWRTGRTLPRGLRWLAPLLLFNLLVLASTLHPGFVRSLIGGVPRLTLQSTPACLPSAARPGEAFAALGQLDALFLSGFNLALLVTRRRHLRLLLVFGVANALALAVFGTFQKLAGAPGIYFGAIASPNERFFASFIYQNHWGAFALLFTTVAIGLGFHAAAADAAPGRRHSPALLAVVAVAFLAGSIPLSASRSCTLLALLLLTGALVHLLLQMRRDRRAAGRTATMPVVLACSLFVLAILGIGLLGRRALRERLIDTREQFTAIRVQGNLGSRQQLYADTWEMAREKPVFGWGLGSYATTFQLFNRQVSVEGWVPFYAQAHSDWLQSLAEVGCLGSALLGLLVVLPLGSAFRYGRPNALPACLLIGCGLLVLYALVEFPFANPAVVASFWICFFAAIRLHRLDAAAAHSACSPS